MRVRAIKVVNEADTTGALHRNEDRYIWISFRSGSIKVGTG